jgi:putative glycosyltransferase
MSTALSVVTTLYRSEAYVQEFYRRVTAAAEALTRDFELIFVNDGSPDGSLDAAVSIARADSRVVVVDLSRNFGHHKAIMTGLGRARGDLVFLIDSDLEESPELLAEFHGRMTETDADVVYGVQRSRTKGILDRASSALFYTVFNYLSTDAIPENVMTVRLMRREYVAALLEHREREICIAGLWSATGFVQVSVPVAKLDRGATSYSFVNRVSVLVQALTSFSAKPLLLIFYLGTLISALAACATVYLVVRRLLFGVYLEGWPSLIVSVWLMGGVIIFSIGIIGIYLSKMFVEVKQRPYTIVRRVYGAEDHNGR